MRAKNNGAKDITFLMAAKLSDSTHTSEICSPGQAGVARMPCAAPLILSICLSACYIMQAADIPRPTVVLLTGLTKALEPLPSF